MNIKLLLSVMLTLLPKLVSAYDFEFQGIFYNVISVQNFTVEVTRGNTHAYKGSITIPQEVEFNGRKLRVIKIGNYAFSGCSGLTNIKIPSVLQEIKVGTFSGCTNLTSVTIPNSVTSIRTTAFEGCSSLTEANIPNSVEEIGDGAFGNCSSLAKVTIPRSVTCMGEFVFCGCTNLTNVKVTWENPLDIDSLAFGDTPMNRSRLFVPRGTYAKYASADVWKKFPKIIEYDIND